MEQKTTLPGPADPYRIEAVDRAMHLLTLLLDGGDVGVTDAARKLDVAPSTVHRLLSTMTYWGFVDHAPSRRYRAGSRLTGEGPVAGSIPALRRTLRPCLLRLYAAVAETVHISMLTGAESQFIGGIEGGKPLRVGLRLGARIPAYCTSGGKALLAELPAEMVTRLHDGGLLPWPTARVGTLDELRGELLAIRHRRYAVNHQESEQGVAAVGAVVAAVPGWPRVAISVAMPAVRCDDSRETEVANALRVACLEGEQLLAAAVPSVHADAPDTTVLAPES